MGVDDLRLLRVARGRAGGGSSCDPLAECVGDWVEAVGDTSGDSEASDSALFRSEHEVPPHRSEQVNFFSRLKQPVGPEPSLSCSSSSSFFLLLLFARDLAFLGGDDWLLDCDGLLPLGAGGAGAG